MPEFFPPLTQKIFIIGVIFLLGAFIGTRFEIARYSSYLDGFKTIRQTDDPYRLVAPLVGIDSPSALTIGHFADLDKQIQSYAEGHRDDIGSFGLYYRDLDSSQWFGINEGDKYIPASLLKIALAFVVLKQEDADPRFAAMKKVYTPKIAAINSSVPFLEPSELVVGRAYRTQDLLEKMLIDSDNGAKDLLYSAVDKKYFLEIFRLLGVAEPRDPLAYELSPKDYALFFRMLYGGTYLSSDDSERLLEILTRTQFNDGVVAGVPSNITVAHKFGTFTLTDKSGAKAGIELHDCGVVYHPVSPYILCIMTKGKEPQQLAHFIADISAIVYKNVDARARWKPGASGCSKMNRICR